MIRSGSWRSGLVAVFLGVAAAVVIGSSASAHTDLIDSTPADGDTVGELDRVRLEFSSGLLGIGARLVIVSDDAAPRELDVYFVSERVVEADGPVLQAGDHVLQWRVVASDGHPIEGEIAFVVDPPASPTPASSPAPSNVMPTPPLVDLANGDFGEHVSQNLGPLGALLIALVGAALVAVAWFIARRVAARERQDR